VEKAAAAGQTTTLSAVLERARSGRTATAMLRLDPADAARALAARKGIPWETYLKRLLQEALDRDEGSR
jgi:hypothetical protein